MAILVLFRHAKAAQAEPGQRDFDRPLMPRGRADAAKAGEILAGVKLHLALVSASRRTRETWDVASDVIGRAVEVSVEDGLYLCSPAKLIERLRKVPTATKSVVVVGHNPCLHEVALWLMGASGGLAAAAIREKFPTSAIAVFRIPDEGWEALSPETARLKDFQVPRG